MAISHGKQGLLCDKIPILLGSLLPNAVIKNTQFIIGFKKVVFLDKYKVFI